MLLSDPELEEGVSAIRMRPSLFDSRLYRNDPPEGDLESSIGLVAARGATAVSVMTVIGVR